MRIRVAVLDMAGTTLADEVGGVPFVLAAYARAFAGAGVALEAGALNSVRGLDKRAVIRATLAERRGLEGAALEGETERVLARFEEACLDLLGEVRPAPGAAEACRWLGARGVFVALASGLPQKIAGAMAEASGLAAEAGYLTTGERAGGGRPGPEMINDVLIRCGLLGPETERGRAAAGFAYGQVLKVGDTPADVREGAGVGAVTVAVASGTHGAESLRRAGAEVVLGSIAELPAHVAARGLV